VEAAVYFCCLEALQNAAKHAAADRVTVTLRNDGDRLAFTVTDDGRGFDPATVLAANGLANMRDRVDSLGGRLTWVPAAGSGTTVSGWVPAARRLTTAG
jgi:signal transduction histidine kinase